MLCPAASVQFGYYSLLAASRGCRVVAWEPVPYFAAFFKYALLRNNMTRVVQVRAGPACRLEGCMCLFKLYSTCTHIPFHTALSLCTSPCS